MAVIKAYYAHFKLSDNEFEIWLIVCLFLILQAKIREAMEKAFWDNILESLKRDDSDYDQVVQLMREMRDELCLMAPNSWRQMIIESIDLDILSQVVWHLLSFCSR